MTHVDALSRDLIQDTIELSQIDITEGEWLLAVQMQDEQFVIVEAVKDTRARYVTKTLLNYMYIFGSSTRIISDRGTAFTSRTFKLFCDNYGAKHTLNAVATPRSNGQCERGKSRRSLGRACEADSVCVVQSTGVSPLEALAGFKPRHISESYILNEVQADLSRVDIHTLRQTISGRISEDQRRQKERFDKKRAEATKYEEGQLVRINNALTATGGSKKLLPRFKGPFRVFKVLPNDRYEVEDLRESFSQKRTVVAVDSMKPWIVLKG
ncbi:uncharacterized protein LOC126747193 [Anthonomus grandis grandis]|uniref:uncharacterized protein LOC126747193 n=1 Tax=Anthonomus grandis grandis TaxID=2921223 RepID=UPI002165198E|nr:uncharacterized protein LOC126747193 [Anthonomus grandis grandis]